MIIDSHSEQETIDAGRAFAQRLPLADVLLLYGDLGAGKTAFVRGLRAGPWRIRRGRQQPHLHAGPGVRRWPIDAVSTPTCIASPRMKPPTSGLADIGEEGVLAIEWADRLGRPFPRAPHHPHRHPGDDRRRIVIPDCLPRTLRHRTVQP